MSNWTWPLHYVEKKEITILPAHICPNQVYATISKKKNTYMHNAL